MGRYGRSSTLDAQIEKLKASLANGERCYKKLFEDAAEACWTFEADHRVFLQKKDDKDNFLKSIEEDMAVTRQKSQ